MTFFFSNIVLPYLKKCSYTDICEIGVSHGLNSDRILELSPNRLVLIDPSIDTDLKEKYADKSNIKIYTGLSLDMLPTVKETFDCIFIDGDHNWFTVYNELKLIRQLKLLRPGGTIFFHDVCWPYGRRDLYYLPETIPSEYRHEYKKAGMVKKQSRLAITGGKNSTLFNADHEGGKRNGVLTAIEDFLIDKKSEYRFFTHRRQYGLGVMISKGGSNRNSNFSRLFFQCRIEELKSRFRSITRAIRSR